MSARAAATKVASAPAHCACAAAPPRLRKTALTVRLLPGSSSRPCSQLHADTTSTNTQFENSILETRKTAPGLRLFDKWAVLAGGGSNHRMGLYDMMMIKDNHVAAAGGIR